jgi:hypothetical protein
MLMVPGIVYTLLSSSELQEWNSPTEKKHIDELQKLRPQQTIDMTVKQDTQYSIEEETFHKVEQTEK